MNMTTNKKNEIEKQEQPIYIVSQPMDSNDEIDLMELFNVIWKKKTFLISWCFVITLISLIIAYSMSKTYTAKATFYPPTETDVSSLNIDNVYTITPNETYSYLVKNITLRKVQHDTFHQLNKNIKEPHKTTFRSFYNSVSLKVSNSNKKSLITTTETVLSFSNKDAEMAANSANALLTNAIAATKEDICSLRKKIIASTTEKITQEINILREYAKSIRLDEIAKLEANDKLEINKINNQIKSIIETEKEVSADLLIKLQEAKDIAESMGIDDPLEHTLKTISKANINSSSTFNTDLQRNSSLLYKEGTIALEARIEALKKRKSFIAFIPGIRVLQAKLKKLKLNEKVVQLKARTNDDPFISELRPLEKKISLLDKANKSKVYFTPLSCESLANIPTSSKPRKLYILLAGMLFAMISGLGVVLIHHFIKKYE